MYSFPIIGNPSSASLRSVLVAVAVITLVLLSGFGIIYLGDLAGMDTAVLGWVPAVMTAPAIVLALFAVVRAEAQREALFREMSVLVSDAVHGVEGIDLSERDIRRMVDGEEIPLPDGGKLSIIRQGQGRNAGMSLETNYDALDQYEDADTDSTEPVQDNQPSTAQPEEKSSVEHVTSIEAETGQFPVSTPVKTTELVKVHNEENGHKGKKEKIEESVNRF